MTHRLIGFLFLLSNLLLMTIACSLDPKNNNEKNVTKGLWTEFSNISLPYYIHNDQLSRLSQYPLITNPDTNIFSAQSKQVPLYAIGKIVFPKDTIALLYAFSQQSNNYIHLVLINTQNQQLISYPLAYQKTNQTKVALIQPTKNIQTAIHTYNYNNETNQHIFRDSTLIQYFRLGEPIFNLPIDTIQQQDINTDGTYDEIFIVPPIINIPYPENPNFFVCNPNPCKTLVKFSLPNLPPIEVPTHEKIKIKNIGDLDENQYTDLLISTNYQWQTYQTAYVYAYNLKNTATWQLIDSIQTYNSHDKNVQIKKINLHEFLLIAKNFDHQKGVFYNNIKKINF
ncbi:MAG: hypothetical protein JNM36_10485 [Chitinophagales bacterium]|nr:hypothetical protein [Chitinophagales bacterium]HNI44318.1 hypothetical protein [Chitinophagales bacterium]